MRILWILSAALLAIGLCPSVAGAAAPERRTLEGVVRTLAADTVTDPRPAAFTGPSRDVHEQFLLVGERAYGLPAGTARPNTRVRISGIVSADGEDIDPVVVSPGGVAAGIPASGTTRVLVMLAAWAGHPPDAVTPASARAQLFGDSSGWFQENSYGTLAQAGDVTSWMTVSKPPQGCYSDYDGIMSDAKAGAAARGYALSAYDNYVVYFPYCNGDAAGFGGWGYVGAAGVWLNGYMDRRVTVHEQGHNYGLYHSHSNLCSGGGLTGICAFEEYGDPYDPMGLGTGHFNAPQKARLGWLGARTVDLSDGGDSTLAPWASAGDSPHAVSVTMASGRRYWMEYRQRLGFDTALDGATDGVLVHVTGPGTGSADQGSSLVDVRPRDGIDEATATLRSGDCWVSPDGIRLSVASVSAFGAGVSVRKGGKCTSTVTVTRAGTGTGSVSSDPAGVDCGATCAKAFVAGAVVRLTATPAGGSRFVGWSGDCGGTSATCALTAAGAPAVTAEFARGSADGNLVANPSFETDLSGWSGLAGYVAQTYVGEAPDGARVALVQRSSGASYGMSDEAAPGRATVGATAAGATYVATVSVRAAAPGAAGKPVSIVLRERTPAGALVRETTATATLGRSFARVAVAATALAAGDTLGVRVLQGSAAEGDAFHADLVTLRAAAAVLGTTVAGPALRPLAANAKRVARFASTSSRSVDLSHLTARLDGLGATRGSQPLRGLLYADAGGAPGAIIARTIEVPIAAGRAAGWVALRFAAPVRVPAGTYWLGLHAGGSAPVARIAVRAQAGAGRSNRDAYADGTATPFGAAATDGMLPSLYAVGG